MHFRDVSNVPETYRQPRSQVLSLASRKNLIAAGHVAPKIWEPKIRGGGSWGNNGRYDKSHSVGAREEFAASLLESF